MITLGIDPGLSGALALLIDDDRIILRDMPTFEIVKSNKRRNEIDVHALIKTLCDMHREYSQIHCVIERAGARPGEGTASSWKNGCNWGMVYTAVAAVQFPVQIIQPAVWKKAMGVPADKDGARLVASRLLPRHAHNWVAKKHDGRAEAALMALYAKREMQAKGR
jgi:crossover junction endodeoxyribonuclease RuvC